MVRWVNKGRKGWSAWRRRPPQRSLSHGGVFRWVRWLGHSLPAAPEDWWEGPGSQDAHVHGLRRCVHGDVYGHLPRGRGHRYATAALTCPALPCLATWITYNFSDLRNYVTWCCCHLVPCVVWLADLSCVKSLANVLWFTERYNDNSIHFAQHRT